MSRFSPPLAILLQKKGVLAQRMRSLIPETCMLRYQNGGLFSEQSFEPPVAAQMVMYQEQPCVVD
jgi:hypothetical protein